MTKRAIDRVDDFDTLFGARRGVINSRPNVMPRTTELAFSARLFFSFLAEPRLHGSPMGS